MIFSHESPEYMDWKRWHISSPQKHNGAFYYSCEIVDNIIPNVKTTRNWVTINMKGHCWNHSIVFIHNNKIKSLYKWLRDYDDLVLVCGIPETCDMVADLGTPIYLPLSVDVAYVEQFKRPKDKGICFAGRQEKRFGIDLGRRITTIENVPREIMLSEVARHEKCYAVGRCAIEAKILGCEILPYDPRFPDVDRWQVLDNRDAATILQAKLDEIDGCAK